jgi:AcrR family transcriptional regulator
MSSATEPRRQARGLLRIGRILDAASDILGTEGPEGLTMNEVARRASISPGSLYQFFSDRQQLLATLAERYAAHLARAMPPAPDDEVVRSGALADLVSSVVDPILVFLVRNPGCRALFRGEGGELERIIEPVHDTLIERILGLIRVRAPQLSDVEARRVAQMCDLLFTGLAPSISYARGAQRRWMIDEAKAVIVRYLEPMDAGPPATD